ncbi:hypothetical protein RB614_11525 [Phytohabitans sp. ZYX-F-186]|uniref:SpaA-like prealbumin fold domain-containing protein n=1 Tax=Phytohabitans maris TaxID=3071409 RepID=A0ABU0ZGU3_9ACTN|nr:hypothetical protein [Phytohabitans sp. ZYX-F-186]MDQ7905152.1 hypothetical protein [Phytohabitans sp. ZYX-F-186]
MERDARSGRREQRRGPRHRVHVRQRRRRQPAAHPLKNVTGDAPLAPATAWTLHAGGPTPLSGTSGSNPVTNVLVTAGTYTLSETNGPPGYDGQGWTCTDADGNPVAVSQDNTVTIGAKVTCTLTNRRQGLPVTGPSHWWLPWLAGLGALLVIAGLAVRFAVNGRARLVWRLPGQS